MLLVLFYLLEAVHNLVQPYCVAHSTSVSPVNGQLCSFPVHLEVQWR